MNIKQYYSKAITILEKYEIDAPTTDVGVILCHALGCDRSYIYTHYDRILNEQEITVLDEMLSKRANNIPLQYIIGHTEFMSLDFEVSSDVLIPRSDTEILVEKCIQLASENRSNWGVGGDDIPSIKILDMCTGSGCISISLAHYIDSSMITACDISSKALSIARNNAVKNNVSDRINFFQGDLFEALDNDEAFTRFHVIASNPPYIETQTIDSLQAQVKDFEPMLALDGGADGLDFYKKIIEEAPKHLEQGGFLVLEIGYNQAQSVSGLMGRDFSNIEVIKDYGHNDRVVLGKYL